MSDPQLQQALAVTDVDAELMMLKSRSETVARPGCGHPGLDPPA
jgi:hypothetical protein